MYRYAEDTEAGDAKAHGVDDSWCGAGRPALNTPRRGGGPAARAGGV